jgi:elongation factor P--(R)-beta-lysine ligase
MRKVFLADVWSAYPAMPTNLARYGRLLSVNEKSLIFDDGELFPLSERVALKPVRPGYEKARTSFSLEKVLQKKDLVGLQIEKDEVTAVWLLAPHIESLPIHAEINVVRQFSLMLQKVREFFIQRDFLEAQTPTLVECPGTEPFLQVFSTEMKIGSHRKKFFLPTSPEIHLKKLLSAGSGPIFEIKNVFRNGEISAHHEPEF